MINIQFNGRAYGTMAENMHQLQAEIYAGRRLEADGQTDSIWIVNGFQTNENLPLDEGMTVNWIRKGQMPGRDEMESMLCARHTPAVHEKVKKARVAIAGLGGLGSNIAVMLARTGVGHLHLIDFDIVEPSNLNRQQYMIEHLGMFKTDAMAAQLLKINPYIQVQTDTVKIDEDNCLSLFKGDEIICEAFDRAEAKAMLTEQVLYGYPEKTLICGSGMAGYGPNNQITTRKINEHFYICGDGVSEARPGWGLMAPRVTICAAHQANMALRCIMGLDAEDKEENYAEK